MTPTFSRSVPRIGGARVRFWSIGVVVVWGLATVAGLLSHLAGAIVALIAGSVLLWYGATRGHLPGVPSVWRKPGAWGIVMMALSPLVPARLGPSWAGVSLDDLPLLVGVALALWAVVTKEGWSKVVHPVAIPLWLFALWSGISTAVGGSFTVAEMTRGIGRWGLFALAFSLLLRLALRPGMGRIIVLAVLGVGLIEALFGIWAYVVDWAVLSDDKAHLIGLEMWRWYQPLFGEIPGRIAGTLGISTNFFGALMLIPTFLAIGLMARVDEPREWVPTAMIVAACFFGLILTYTRASQIALLVGLILFLALVWRWRVAGVIAGLVVAAVILTPSLSRFTAEANDRGDLTQQAIERISEKPITGSGSGNFVNRTDILIATPHNSYLLAASETGIVGGVLLIAATLAPGLCLAWEVTRRRGRDPLLVGITIGMLAFGIQTFSNSLFHIPSVAVGYWMVAAGGVGWVATARQRRLEIGNQLTPPS